jgi:hypothetical protein
MHMLPAGAQLSTSQTEHPSGDLAHAVPCWSAHSVGAATANLCVMLCWVGWPYVIYYVLQAVASLNATRAMRIVV